MSFKFFKNLQKKSNRNKFEFICLYLKIVLQGAWNINVVQTWKLTNTYSFLYENDHFNQAQAEFKKVLNGQSKQAQAEKRGKKEEEKGRESVSCMVHTLQKIDRSFPGWSFSYKRLYTISHTFKCNKCCS